MIQNNLDPEVAENPKELVVYGGIGRAARNWDCFDAILAALRELDDDESLLIQSGKPVGVFKTHPDAPRVLIANSNLVPKWATWEHFNELDRKGLMMYGQMTAGSWIYIGSQGIVQGTYETFAEAGRQHFGGELAGRWILTAGLGGMGGAQPLAATMAGASCSRSSASRARIDFRLRTRYLDQQAQDLDDALAILRDAAREGSRSRSACSATRPRSCRSSCGAACGRDLVTDQTSAHDLVHGYLPAGWTRRAMAGGAGRSGAACGARSRPRSARSSRTSRRCSTSRRWACRRSTTATTSARSRSTKAWRMRSTFPASCRPTSGRCSAKGKGPFRWVALSGDPEDIYKTDARSRSSFRTTRICIAGSTWRASASRSRGCRRASAGSGWASGTSPASRSTKW